jgi:hypothetical protein
MRLTSYSLYSIVSTVGFEVEVTDEFANWYLGLTEDEQLAIDVRVELLAEEGPKLKRPVVGEIVGSKFDPQMKELRATVGRSVLRVLFMFDPRRTAILLIGGNKAVEWKPWYRTAIPTADHLYQLYLQELRDEGML